MWEENAIFRTITEIPHNMRQMMQGRVAEFRKAAISIKLMK